MEIRNVDDALVLSESNKEQFPSIAVIRKDHGSQKVEAIIKLYLVELCELVNLKRPLTEKQIDAIAQEVVSRYYSMTIADIHVIFRKAKNGEFGELYESLDMPKVMKWFWDYFNDRCLAGANLSLRVHDSNYDKGGNMTPERIGKQFERLEKQLKRKQ
ncbi:MAG TPA: hypothetical protein DEG28_06630 [Porphyromonadaceae bacterium]|nr:hypothetical protein [Porphyromonadaceae bacterium]